MTAKNRRAPNPYLMFSHCSHNTHGSHEQWRVDVVVCVRFDVCICYGWMKRLRLHWYWCLVKRLFLGVELNSQITTLHAERYYELQLRMYVFMFVYVRMYLSSSLLSLSLCYCMCFSFSTLKIHISIWCIHIHVVDEAFLCRMICYMAFSKSPRVSYIRLPRWLR